MRKYIAFLRGINISGRNKISMSDLKTEKENLSDILDHAPHWWGTGNKEKYDNLIFVITEDTTDEICDMLGRPSDGLESVQVYKDVIFWTFDRKAYQKCNWWKKTAGAGIAEKLTIRTANTVKKMFADRREN